MKARRTLFPLTIVLINTFGRAIKLIELARSKQFYQASLIRDSILVLGVVADARAKTIVPIGRVDTLWPLPSLHFLSWESVARTHYLDAFHGQHE